MSRADSLPLSAGSGASGKGGTRTVLPAASRVSALAREPSTRT